MSQPASVLTRHSDAWYLALDAYVEARRMVPFAWGANDCCTFAADWIQIARGIDPMADRRGLAGAKACARVLAREGGVLGVVQARMGAPIAGGLAQVGDVVLMRHGAARESLSMGVCLGAVVAVPGPAGLELAPITQAEAAWRV